MSYTTTYFHDCLIIAAPILLALAIATAVIILARLHFVGQTFTLSIAAAFAIGLVAYAPQPAHGCAYWGANILPKNRDGRRL